MTAAASSRCSTGISVRTPLHKSPLSKLASKKCWRKNGEIPRAARALNASAPFYPTYAMLFTEINFCDFELLETLQLPTIQA